MSMSAAIWAGIALAATTAGLALLRTAWLRRRTGGHARFVLAGWAALLLATLFWLPPNRAIYGVTLSLIAIECVALATVFWRTPWHRPVPAAAEPRRTTGREPARAWRTGLRGLAVTALAGPAAMAGALVLAILLFMLARWAGWNEANRLALALFVVPIVWTLLATLAVIDMKLRYRTAALLLPLLAGGAILALITGVQA